MNELGLSRDEKEKSYENFLEGFGGIILTRTQILNQKCAVNGAFAKDVML